MDASQSPIVHRLDPTREEKNAGYLVRLVSTERIPHEAVGKDERCLKNEVMPIEIKAFLEKKTKAKSRRKRKGKKKRLSVVLCVFVPRAVRPNGRWEIVDPRHV